MKKEVLVIAVLVGLFLAISPLTSRAMEPAESQAVDTCFPSFEATPSGAYMGMAESQEVDRTGTPWAAAEKRDLVACK